MEAEGEEVPLEGVAIGPLHMQPGRRRQDPGLGLK